MGLVSPLKVKISTESIEILEVRFFILSQLRFVSGTYIILNAC